MACSRCNDNRATLHNVAARLKDATWEIIDGQPETFQRVSKRERKKREKEAFTQSKYPPEHPAADDKPSHSDSDPTQSQ